MRPLKIAALALSTLLATGAQAQQPAAAGAPAAPAATTTAKGDVARGHELTYTCKGCHGVTGYKNAYPNYHVTRIAGRKARGGVLGNGRVRFAGAFLGVLRAAGRGEQGDGEAGEQQSGRRHGRAHFRVAR
jgi:hypothetical protein